MIHSYTRNFRKTVIAGLFMSALSILVLSMLFSPNMAQADEVLKEAATAACNNIKMCIAKQIGDDNNIPPAMRKMIDGLAKEACNGLYQMHQKLDQTQYYSPILQCYQDMSKISCEDLGNKVQPKACAALDEAL